MMRENKAAILKLDIKQITDEGIIEGYGAVFGNVDFTGDVLLKGAFLDTLGKMSEENRTIPMLWQHQGDAVIGVWEVLKEDDKGLWVRGKVFLETQGGKEAFIMLKGGAVTGLSIGYVTRSADYSEDMEIRYLRQVDLEEISVVTFPANDMARIEAVKSIKQRIAEGELPATISDFEKFLRDAGFSKKNATIIAGHGIKGLLREAETEDLNAELSKILNQFNLK